MVQERIEEFFHLKLLEFRKTELGVDLASLNGEVYQSGTRKHGSTSEDQVIKLLAGRGSTTMEGVININTYISHINSGGDVFVKDTLKAMRVSEAMNNFKKWLYNQTQLFGERKGFQIALFNDVNKTFKDQATGQYYVHARLEFTYRE